MSNYLMKTLQSKYKHITATCMSCLVPQVSTTRMCLDILYSKPHQWTKHADDSILQTDTAMLN